MPLATSSWLTIGSLSLVARALKALQHDISIVAGEYIVMWLYGPPHASVLKRSDIR